MKKSEPNDPGAAHSRLPLRHDVSHRVNDRAIRPCFSAGLQGQAGVYFLHDFFRFHQGDDNLLVVADFI